MGNNKEELSRKLYDLCKKIAEHPLHLVERCLIIHNTKEEFRNEIGLNNKAGLNTYGSELNLYDTQDGYPLEDCYRLLLNNHNYRVTPTEIIAPDNKIDQLFKTAEKKLEKFDWAFNHFETKAKEEACTDYSLKSVLENYQITWLLYKNNKSKFTRQPKKFEERKDELCFKILDNYLDIENDEELKIWQSADIAILILFILDILPEYGKSPKAYNINMAFTDMLKLMQKYHKARSRRNESITLSTILEQKEKGDFPLNKFSLITSLKDIIDEIWSEISPSAQTELNDSMLYGHQQFCTAYNIQGLWIDDRGCFWNIRETGDYCLMYKISFSKVLVEYTKYTLITDITSESACIFDIREAANVMNLFRGEKIDISKIDQLEVELLIPKEEKKNEKKRVESIKLKSLKFRNNLFRFNELKRANDQTFKAIKRKWDTLMHKTTADYTFYRSMVAITSEHIYVGSYERDNSGKHHYFYKLSKENVLDLLGDSLYYVDFNQSVGVYKAYWADTNETHYYLSIDSKGIYIDTNQIVNGEIDGIEITDEDETIIIQQFVEIDQAGEEKLTMEDLEQYASPFYYL